MKRVAVSGVMVALLVGGLALLAASGHAQADEPVKSGIPVGKRVPTYSTTKCGGVADGVKDGASLCYT